MKRIISTVIYFLIFSPLVFSQQIPSSAEKRIDLITRVLATELQLNEAAYIKLRALNRERILKADEVAIMYSNDQEIIQAKLAQIEADFDKQFATILNSVQLAAYKSYKEESDEKLTALKVNEFEVNNAPAKASLANGQSIQ